MTTIAIEVNHQWCQRLPLRDNVLVCIGCEQTKPIRAPLDGIMPCADVKAWQTPGATASGGYLIMPLRLATAGQGAGA
ncbi:hypothetical protein H5J25_13690 [Sphingomonas aliaeris]|uniref:Uncharacterized protein n=1 Tax=Sphingomonas aliaeris TaxID=2759526 RepID=A0A974S3F7_9SPHN|nr:hypothetical protein [Sphingomonas aliaeris]QQV76497.1 hypothetical protein H5J25_13690 [Sphingomonas aliaeris]